MEFESVKKYLEQGGGIEDEHRAATLMSSLPSRFFENFILQHIHVDLIHPGRLVCSMKLPHQLVNADNILHGGVIATLVDTVGSAALYTVGVCMDRVSVEINVSYLDAARAGIPVNDAYLGRVINALAKPIDGRGEISASESRLIESPAPGIISRRSIYDPLQKRLIVVDSMIPIGRGQRELIIGDRQTGKTAVVMDTILNQQGQNEEIEIEAKVLKVGMLIDVISVDFREKNTRKLIAQGRHSMYIVGPSSKL